MNKWKYKVEYVKLSSFKTAKDRTAVIQEKLTRLGMESWELVNTVPEAAGYNYSVFLYLKRPY